MASVSSEGKAVIADIKFHFKPSTVMLLSVPINGQH
jgi:hypothetical protein